MSATLQDSAPPTAAVLNFIEQLARAYQQFERISSRHIHSLGLTPSQFDIIATLGATKGMTCKVLSERTLITKGTLTGVLDRLEKKALICRTTTADKRSWMISLTAAGEACFAEIFPVHLAYLRQVFSTVSTDDLERLTAELARWRKQIAPHGENFG